jgi:hypothetical protein
VYDGASWIAATSAGNVSFLQYEYTATLGQTTFSGADDNSATLSYTVANLIVTLNGVVLDNGGDYTATNGTSVVLTSGAAAGDLLQVIAFKSFTVADMVPASTGGTFAGNVSVPAGATGTQVPQVQEVVKKSGDTMTGSLGIGGNVTGVIAGVSVDSKFCVKQEGTDPVAGFVKAENTTAGAGSGTFACRSRGTLASPTVVQSGDALWNMYVAGHDGTDLALAAEIAVEVDGTPGSNDMPGRIVFKTTPDGQQAPVESMRLDSSGDLQFNSGYGSVATAYGCRAWVNFNGNAGVSVRDSGNVSSVVRNSTGVYTINFSTSMPDANYSFGGQYRSLNDGDPGLISQRGSLAAGSFQILAGVRTASPFESATMDTITLHVFR